MLAVTEKSDNDLVVQQTQEFPLCCLFNIIHHLLTNLAMNNKQRELLGLLGLLGHKPPSFEELR